MSKRQLTIVTPTHTIDLSYRKKVYAKQNYALSLLNIEAKSQKSLMKAQLDQSHNFRHFQNLQAFYQHIFDNKKKDVFAVDDRGFFSVTLIEGNRQYDSEVVNLTQTLQQGPYDQQQSHQREMKSRVIRKMEKDIKTHLKNQRKNKKVIVDENKQKAGKNGQGNNGMNKNQNETIAKVDTVQPYIPVIREILFTKLNTKQSFQLGNNLPQISFETTLAELEKTSCKVKLDKILCCQKVIIGLHFNNQSIQQKVCEFNVTSWGSSISVLQGHTLQISYEEGELLIRNISNNNGKMFQLNPTTQQQTSQCLLKISMESL